MGIILTGTSKMLAHVKILPLLGAVGFFCACTAGESKKPANKSSLMPYSRNLLSAESISMELPRRIVAAAKLNEREQHELQHILLARLPRNWDITWNNPAINDLYVLGEIGNEQCATVLRQIYPAIPASDEDIAACVHSSVASIYNRLGVHQFEVAADADLYFEDRTFAAMQLNDSDLQRLRKLLLSRFPGDYDVKTLSDVDLLSEVGDESTAKTLEAYLLMYPDVPGKIRAEMAYDIKRIRERHKSHVT